MNLINMQGIPVGWRFYTSDCSIIGRCSVMFKRDAYGTKYWHELSEEDQETTPLYMSGTGPSLGDAIYDTIEKVKEYECV